MSRALIVQLAADRIDAVVARASGGGLQVDAVETVPIVGNDMGTAAKQLVTTLEPYQPAKAKILLAVPSASVNWHYLTLPPSPPEDLPALVQLQLDLDVPRDDEPIGYDFLPLASAPEHPQRVLAMVLKVAELARARNFGRVSGLRLDGLVPVAFGWPSIEVPRDESSAAVECFIAAWGTEATIWAWHAGEIALLRQVQLPEDSASSNVVPVIASQLRRTLLSLAQDGMSTEAASIYVVGETDGAAHSLAEWLGERLAREVVAVAPQNVDLSTIAPHDRGGVLPMLGLGGRALRGEPPMMDFLHPRKPPAPQSNRRTLVLGGIVAALLVGIIGWQGYVALNEPIWMAEELEDEIYQINQELEPLQIEERDAARIRDWLAETPNLLAELADLSRDWRPQPLDAPEFAIANDGVLKRIDITKRTVVLEGNVARHEAVRPLENRLRDTGHRVRREQSEPADDGGQYPWRVQIAIDILDQSTADPSDESPTEAQP